MPQILDRRQPAGQAVAGFLVLPGRPRVLVQDRPGHAASHLQRLRIRACTGSFQPGALLARQVRRCHATTRRDNLTGRKTYRAFPRAQGLAIAEDPQHAHRKVRVIGSHQLCQPVHGVVVLEDASTPARP